MSYDVTVAGSDVSVTLTQTAFQVTISQLGDQAGMDAAIYDPQSIGDDAFARANHTGTQTASTISDFSTAADARITASDKIANVAEDTTPQLGGALDGQGNEVANYKNKVMTSVTGTLTVAAHSGNALKTSGNVTIPTTAGFTCVLIAGGAHTVTFNSTTSAAMATGDVMTIVVESSTVIHAVLTAAADKVSFS